MSGPPHPTIPMAHLGEPSDQPAKFRLLQQVRHAVRTRGYSVRTEKTYVDWIRRFVLFHSRRHPITMGDAEIREFITHLAVDRRVAPATQNQALAAILFLFNLVLRKPVGFVEGIVHSKTTRKLPVVLAPDEIRRILKNLTGTPRLCSLLMYGSGLRVLEAVSLRVKDVDFIRREITVRAGKGDKDRRVPLPDSVAPALRKQLQKVEKQFGLDSAPPASPPRINAATCICDRRSRSPHNEACDLPLAQAFLRYTFVGERNGHPEYPRATWAH